MSPSSCSLEVFLSDLCLSLLDSSPSWPLFLLGLLLEALLVVVSFSGLALAADHLCNSMETLCDHWGLPDDVGGATFMAFGGAVPEITVNAISTVKSVVRHHAHKRRNPNFAGGGGGGSPVDLGIGAILGSGLIAFLVIPSVCALSSPGGQLQLKRRPLLRDLGAYLAALVVLWRCVVDGVQPHHCVLFLGVYVTYLLIVLFGRSLRRSYLKMQGTDLAEKSTSVFRQRYEKGVEGGAEEGLKGNEEVEESRPLLPNTSEDKVGSPLLQALPVSSKRSGADLDKETREGEEASKVVNRLSKSRVKTTNNFLAVESSSGVDHSPSALLEALENKTKSPHKHARLFRLSLNENAQISHTRHREEKEEGENRNSISWHQSRGWSDLNGAAASLGRSYVPPSVRSRRLHSTPPLSHNRRNWEEPTETHLLEEGRGEGGEKETAHSHARLHRLVGSHDSEVLEGKIRCEEDQEEDEEKSAFVSGKEDKEAVDCEKGQSTFSLSRFFMTPVSSGERRKEDVEGKEEVFQDSTNPEERRYSQNSQGSLFSSGSASSFKDRFYFLSSFLNFVEKLTWPLQKLIDATCPDCRLCSEKENWYPLTFLLSFSWIALFSFLVTLVVDRVVFLLEAPSAMGFLGLAFVSVGAEVPDAVNAVTVAKRGYGSMATSACMGSQIINICIGLGLPWSLTLLFHQEVRLTRGSAFVEVSAELLGFSVLMILTMTVLLAVCNNLPFAQIGTLKAKFFLYVYVMILVFLGFLTFCGFFKSRGLGDEIEEEGGGKALQDGGTNVVRVEEGFIDTR